MTLRRVWFDGETVRHEDIAPEDYLGHYRRSGKTGMQFEALRMRITKDQIARAVRATLYPSLPMMESEG